MVKKNTGHETKYQEITLILEEVDSSFVLKKLLFKDLQAEDTDGETGWLNSDGFKCLYF